MPCEVLFVWSVPFVPLTSTHRNANFDSILIVSVHVFSIPGSRLMCRVCKVSIVIRIFVSLCYSVLSEEIRKKINTK